MHLVYRAKRKFEYVENYPNSHLRMLFLAFDRSAIDATSGGIVPLTSAGSFWCTRMIEYVEKFVCNAYFLRIDFVDLRNRLHISLGFWQLL